MTDPHMPHKIRTCTTEVELQTLHNILKQRGDLSAEWLGIIEQTRAELQRKKGVRGR